MSRLPLYDEVREARARSVEANAAAAHLREVEGTTVSIGLLLAQANRHSELENEVPGDELVVALAERWPALSDLASEGPRSTQTYAQRLLARDAQLYAARRTLAPLASEAEHLHHELHHAVNHQAIAMERDGLTEAIAELGAINEQRVAVSQELVSVSTRASRLQPAFSMLDTFVDKLVKQTEKAADGSVLQATLALHLAASLARTTQLAFDELDLDANLPTAPETPSEIDIDEAMREAKRVTVQFVELRELVTKLYADLTAQEQELRSKSDALARSIIERTG